jgi:2-keto-3-deoxy-L-rhamnonate aldolase RhmA
MSAENSAAPGGVVNPLKIALAEGKYVIGSTVTVASVETATQVAAMGFDFLWLEMEHSPITLETLRNIILATRGLKAVPVTRVPVNELWTAKRVLDAGSLGVIFPFCSTPELARQAAAACKYPPHGGRGFGASLASFRWQAPEGYADFADKNIIVTVIIEQEKALENLEAIASTPGIDVMFVGTSDLSYSMGYRGNSAHPRVQEALKRVAEVGKANGKYVGLPVKDSEMIKKYVDWGFQWFQTTSEVGLIARGAKQILEPLGRSVQGPGILY